MFWCFSNANIFNIRGFSAFAATQHQSSMKPPTNHGRKKTLTLWLFNIAMENGPFIDGLLIKK